MCSMKWIWVIVLVVVGIIAAFVAVEYLTTSIHALPSYIPGHENLVHGRKPRGRYHKRGAAAAVIASWPFWAQGTSPTAIGGRVRPRQLVASGLPLISSSSVGGAATEAVAIAPWTPTGWR